MFVNLTSVNWTRSLFFIFTVALLIRLGFVLTLQDGFYFPDSVSYSAAAVNLLGNGELGKTYNRPPGYPVFLAAIYFVFGESVFAVRMVESLVGALLTVIIALIARRIGGEAVGALAGFLWGIYPIAVFLAGLVYPTQLLTILLASGMLCLLPRARQTPAPKHFLFAGVLWGLAALTTPIALVTICAISLWLLYWYRMKALPSVGVLVFGAALTVIPWAIRDFYFYGQPVVVDPRLTRHLPRITDVEDDIRGDKLQSILKHPSQLAEHFVAEFIHFWKIYPDRINMDRPGAREERHKKDSRVVQNTIFTTNNFITIISILSTGPLFLFALIGTALMWFQRERRRDLSLLWMTILSVPVGYSFFITKVRYRIPIEPFITILCSFGLAQTWTFLASRFNYLAKPRGKAEVDFERAS